MRFFLVVLFVLSCNIGASRAQETVDLDWSNLARVIVERLAMEPGERVLVVAHPDIFHELTHPLRVAVMEGGGVDLGVLHVRNGAGRIGADRGQVSDSAAREVYGNMFRQVDAAVTLPGVNGSHPAYGALQDILRSGHARTVHIHWRQDRSGTHLPGQPLPDPSIIDALYEKAVLETDYESLKGIQLRFEQGMRDGEVRVTSALGTDLHFQIGDRPVNRQDGDVSARRTAEATILIDREIELLAGVVRVAPLEETVSGVIAFPPSQWDGRPVTGLKLMIESGRVTGMTAGSGLEYVRSEMERAGPIALSFREFGLGFNPILVVPERNPWIPYYGYGAGVVRLSLGDNSELGGAAKADQPYVRWNFFVNASVTVNGTEWVRDGRLVVDGP
ncbi:MAG: hypothetical protein HOH43_11035 [Candidatus Latescibacteria bacterium]|nr:hypothetical protein [Candidatus Latescibacterota bacterium]